MAVPKQRKTKSRTNQRRMHIFLENPSLTSCPKCNKPAKPHTVCFNCGTYKGKAVIDVLSKLNKKEKKQKEREIEATNQEKSANKPLEMEELSKK